MAAGQSLVLLLVLTVLGTRAAPSAEDCSKLTKALTKADLQKISGDWVLVWLLADNTTLFDGWKNLNSSYVEYRIRSGAIDFTERNMLGNSCMTFKTNATVDSDNQELFRYSSGRVEQNEAVIQFNDIATLKFYETCADCVSLEYSGFLGHVLLIYKRDGLHQKAEELKAGQDHGQKLAECLGFSLEGEPFIYDGVADFCHRQAAKPDQA